MACQTISSPITESVAVPVENQEWPAKSKPSFTRILLRMPYCWSKIHW
jgi:hypothetical protein